MKAPKLLTAHNMPTMAQINRSKKKLIGASTFAGGGGSSTGLKMSGFNILYANEFMPLARDTYAANHPKAFVDDSDIRDVSGKKILKACGVRKGQLHHLDGSPPCSVFSTAGVREEGWQIEKDYSKGKKQRIDDLFFEYTRLIDETKPLTFTAENVSGLIKGKAKGYFKLIHKEFDDLGYDVISPLLNSKWLGVPQSRERIIFLGVRKDLKCADLLAPPKPFGPLITTQDILPHIAMMKRSVNNLVGYYPADVPFPTIAASDHSNGETGMFSSAGYVETKKGVRRRLKIKEIQKLFSYPSDYVFTGETNDQWERLGRSVPPLMMYYASYQLRLIHDHLAKTKKWGHLYK